MFINEHCWKHRNITPLSKVSIINLLFLDKLNIVCLTVLPDYQTEVIDKIRFIFYKFRGVINRIKLRIL